VGGIIRKEKICCRKKGDPIKNTLGGIGAGGDIAKKTTEEEKRRRKGGLGQRLNLLEITVFDQGKKKRKVKPSGEAKNSRDFWEKSITGLNQPALEWGEYLVRGQRWESKAGAEG